ncbi:MAG TPA: cyanophycinase [Chitinophagales bacterium]|nr:cyanophycinase [Chitinophagales bacterium]HRK27939.1 cyanophycinase [Chitinophagales bacterium]
MKINTQHTIGFGVLLLLSHWIFAQKSKGNLFIIGGGKRPDALMQQLLETANLQPQDYIVVLPMASQEPDSAFYYLAKQFTSLTNYPIANLNFDAAQAKNRVWIDSLLRAKLIFISGGDQSRFMKVVGKTPLYDALHKAYRQGATIAGTSAGAAVMCRYMITGNQLMDTVYRETFDKLRHSNLETAEGLGLVQELIIDQHFIKRSRYNRLLSAVVDFRRLTSVGIDEGTAIIVSGNRATVAGESAVVVARKPKGITKNTGNQISCRKKGYATGFNTRAVV